MGKATLVIMSTIGLCFAFLQSNCIEQKPPALHQIRKQGPRVKGSKSHVKQINHFLKDDEHAPEVDAKHPSKQYMSPSQFGATSMKSNSINKQEILKKQEILVKEEQRFQDDKRSVALFATLIMVLLFLLFFFTTTHMDKAIDDSAILEGRRGPGYFDLRL